MSMPNPYPTAVVDPYRELTPEKPQGWTGVDAIVTGALATSPVALVGKYAVSSLMQTNFIQSSL